MTTPAQSTQARIADVVARADAPLSSQEREEALNEIIDLCQEVPDQTSQMLRHTFLFLIAAEPSLLAEGRFSNFLAEHIEPEDFTELKWESPDRVITFCEVLYTLRVPAGQKFEPPVFAAGKYTVRVGDPERNEWRENKGMEAVLL